MLFHHWALLGVRAVMPNSVFIAVVTIGDSECYSCLIFRLCRGKLNKLFVQQLSRNKVRETRVATNRE